MNTYKDESSNVDWKKITPQFLTSNLSKINVTDFDKYNDWLGAVWRLKSLGIDLGDVQSWCSDSSKYDAKAVACVYNNPEKGYDDFKSAAVWFAKEAKISLPLIEKPAFDWTKVPSETKIDNITYSKLSEQPEQLTLSLTGQMDSKKVENTLKTLWHQKSKIATIFGDFKKCDGGKWLLLNPSELYKKVVDSHTNANNYSSDKGATFKINPVSEKKVKEKNQCLDSFITDFKYTLVECDKVDLDTQLSMIKFLKLPYASITFSGNRSIHVLVKVDAGNDLKLYKKRQAIIEGFCKANGFDIDSNCKNPGRESRIPGVNRLVNGTQVLQELIEDGSNSEFKSYEEWYKWAEQFVTIDNMSSPVNVMSFVDSNKIKDVFSDGTNNWIHYNDVRGLIGISQLKILSEIIKNIKDPSIIELYRKNVKGGLRLHHIDIPVKKISFIISMNSSSDKIYNSFEPGFIKTMKREVVKELPSEFNKLLDNLAGENEKDWLINHMSTYLNLLISDFKDSDGHLKKLETIPILYGSQGTGKNTIMKYFAEAVQKRGLIEVGHEEISGAFNEWKESAVLLLNEFGETKTERNDFNNTLKLLTSETTIINKKFMPLIIADFRPYIAIAGNLSEFGVVKIESSNRRYQYIAGGKDLNGRDNKICNMNLLDKQKYDFVNYLLSYAYVSPVTQNTPRSVT